VKDLSSEGLIKERSFNARSESFFWVDSDEEGEETIFLWADLGFSEEEDNEDDDDLKGNPASEPVTTNGLV
jgi:hypothetical protein